MAVFFVLIGGFLGAPLRFFVGRVVKKVPLGTFVINVTGSLLLGMMWAATGGQGAWYALLGTGVLGAYTTFSTFGVEAVTLWEQGRSGLALLYVVGSALCGLAAAWLGWIMVY
ncbi:MAG: fluoride efflux transporter CrcB [Tumebacillaceae bacterium]